MAIPALAATVPRCSLIVEDLTQRSNAELQAYSMAAFPKLALWLLRDARDPARLLSNFDAWIDTFVEVERAPSGVDALRTLLTYLFHVVDPMRRPYAAILRDATPEDIDGYLRRAATAETLIAVFED